MVGTEIEFYSGLTGSRIWAAFMAALSRIKLRKCLLSIHTWDLIFFHFRANSFDSVSVLAERSGQGDIEFLQI